MIATEANSRDAPPITIDALEKTFRTGFRGRSVKALRGVSFQVQPGEVFALLGPNGAGKTTLIKVLLGIIRSSGGRATLLGYPAGDRRGRARVGYLPEHLRIPRHQTARSALDFYGKLSGLPSSVIRARADGLLQQVGLEGRDRESVKRFSKGMLQRLGLAQALLHQPDLLILDEPTDGLDPIGRSQVRSILQRLRDEGRTVFLNSHLLQEVELICDRVAIMDQGILRYVGTIQDLTPSGEGELKLVLMGPADSIRAVFETWVPAPSWTEGQPCSIIKTLQSQSDADRLVDQVRDVGISIRELSWRGRSLEDAFLRLVAKKDSADAVVNATLVAD